jgi:hypothetical protein
MIWEMTYRPTGGPGGKILSLLLAVLLAMSPLLTMAQGGGPAPVEGVGATAQMPCHQDTAQTTPDTDPSRADPCPHCTGDSPASQCHSCGFPTPAGLGTLANPPVTGGPESALRHPLANEALPELPHDDLFRPPIFPS